MSKQERFAAFTRIVRVSIHASGAIYLVFLVGTIFTQLLARGTLCDTVFLTGTGVGASTLLLAVFALCIPAFVKKPAHSSFSKK